MNRRQAFMPLVALLILLAAAPGLAEEYRSGSFVLTGAQVEALRQGSVAGGGGTTALGNVLLNPGFESGALPPWERTTGQ